MLVSATAFGQTYGPVYQSYPNDLVMGFQNQAGGAPDCYIINLGSPANILGQSTVVVLSSDFSLSDFDTVLGSSSSLYAGVIGADNGSGAYITPDIFVTQLRSGGPGNPAVPGSTVTAQDSQTADNTTYADLSTLYTPAVGTGGLDSGNTWESLVDPNNGSGTFQGNTGLNPDSSVSPSTVLYEDLWENSNSSSRGATGFTYLGYFTLDLTGGSPKLTFTSTNVPASLMPPKIASVIKVGSTVTVISSNAVPTHSYQLQYTTSLNPVSWTSVGSSVTAAGTMVTNTDSTATTSQRFYQVQAN